MTLTVDDVLDMLTFQQVADLVTAAQQRAADSLAESTQAHRDGDNERADHCAQDSTVWQRRSADLLHSLAYR